MLYWYSPFSHTNQVLVLNILHELGTLVLDKYEHFHIGLMLVLSPRLIFFEYGVAINLVLRLILS
jgi:hypothetical protein